MIITSYQSLDTLLTTWVWNTVLFLLFITFITIPTNNLLFCHPVLVFFFFTVIIVGHTECGGAAACLGAAQSPDLNLDGPISTISSLPVDSALNRWLEPLTRIAAGLQLSSIPHAEALPIVVEENVKAQVENLANTITIGDAWTKGTKKGQEVWIHGWVYDLATGLLRDLNISRGPPGAAAPESAPPVQ